MWIEVERDEDGDLPDFKVGTLLKTNCGTILFVGDVNKVSSYCSCCQENDVKYFDETHVPLIKSIKEEAKKTLTF